MKKLSYLVLFFLLAIPASAQNYGAQNETYIED